MDLFASINLHLTDELLTQLAAASALPVADARATATAAVPVLVQQLTQLTDADELNARWAMCRQLYLSQLLTQSEELLRPDLGWPERRQLLAQKILSPSQLAALTEPADQPVLVSILLGYLAIIALAVLGAQADKASFTPTEMGEWLARQHVPSTLPLAAGGVRLPVPAGQPVAARTTKPAATSVLVGVAVAGLLGGYFWLGDSVTALQPAAPAVAQVASVAAGPVAEPVVEAASPAPAPAVVAPIAAAKAALTPAAVPTKPTAPAVAAASLRDTVGQAATHRQLAEKPKLSEEPNRKEENQSFLINLANQTTLAVGPTSTEAFLYKRLEHPDLLPPADIAVDRLSFNLSQAHLGAEGTQQLGNLASILKAFPKVRLVVVGHANIHETQALRLCLQRASLTVEELVKQGVAADRLQAQGMLATEQPRKDDPIEKQAAWQGITLKISRL